MNRAALLRRRRQPQRQSATSARTLLSFIAVVAVCAVAQPSFTEEGDDAELALRSLPAHGRSLFDHLVARATPDGIEQHVPFPFPALVADIESHLELGSVRATLFPLGRSLQRAGGGPDFFDSPRIVLAVDGSARTRTGRPTILLKDRLFIGYQPKLRQLEVISYNEALGRFEFQVVKNYAAGSKPQIVYTDRTLCGSCHQSASPIFSRPPWSETPANRHIEAMLLRARPNFHGVSARHGFDVPKAFDDATDRAGMFSTWQALWTRGCARDHGTEADGRSCRADALLAMLQLRLSPASLRGAEPSLLERAVARELDLDFAATWPDGLEIPDVDIPNRDPLVGERFESGTPAQRNEFGRSPEYSPEAISEFAHVDAVLEPGNKRAPRAIWHGIRDTPGRTHQVIAGLASFLAGADIKGIDRLLLEAGESAEVVTFETSCDETQVPDGPLLLACGGKGPAGEPLHLTLSLHLREGRPNHGTLRKIDAGPLGQLANLDLVRSKHQPGRFRLREPRYGLTARFESGDALLAATLVRVVEADVPSRWDLRIEIRRDYDVLEAAVARVRDGDSDALSDRPLRREAVVRALRASLGGRSDGPWCCAAEAPDLPAPEFGVP